MSIVPTRQQDKRTNPFCTNPVLPCAERILLEKNRACVLSCHGDGAGFSRRPWLFFNEVSPHLNSSAGAQPVGVQPHTNRRDYRSRRDFLASSINSPASFPYMNCPGYRMVPGRTGNNKNTRHRRHPAAIQSGVRRNSGLMIDGPDQIPDIHIFI
jgi:hypothetical protein